MKPETIGRILGIGVRVTGRFIGQQISAATQPANPAGATTGVRTGVESRSAGRTASQLSRGIARGAGGFLAPLRRAGRIVWLEVTGVFFFLPVLVFAPTLWRVRSSYVRGPEHSTFLLTASVMLLFFYLSVSSFWRARKR